MSNIIQDTAPHSKDYSLDKTDFDGTFEHKESITAAAQYASDSSTSEAAERKLVRKIDIMLVPWLSVLYLLSFLDRTSIGNAKLYGLEEDIHITDTQYLLCLTIFFFSYCLFEVPSNIFLKRLRPSIWLSFLMLMWGIMMTVQGLVHNYAGLLGMRWLLGMFEAGLFPGVTYYLSCWYKRSEFGLRVAIFFSAATVSGAFGGLLAAAISNMDGIGGKPAWAWIFIIEGLITVVAGVASFWIVQDFPETAKFLTDAERLLVIHRLQSDGQFSAAGEKMRRKYIWQSLRDYKTYLGMIMLMGTDGPLFGFSLFLPSIISKLGFSATPANLLTVPVFFVACVVTCGVGFWADRVNQRGYFCFAFYTVGAAGYLILIFSRNAALSYFAVYLAACGIYPTLSNVLAWQANNVEGSLKRSVTLAMAISFGNLNGAVASNVYRAVDAPWYSLGHGIMLTYIVLGLLGSIGYHILLKRENARRDRGERDELITGTIYNGEQGSQLEKNGTFNSVEDARMEKGDDWSQYRYTI